ncbi:MAG: hypothetical protein IJT36_01360 [Alphaproteobacteria bacterium]|nr:hypothetical protein [Alphaproteobacteria bacterium]
MIWKSFKSSLFIIPATVALILFSTYLWNPSYLIAPPPYTGFAFQLEAALAVLLIVFYSFILTNRFEIELGLVNGYGTLKLALTKAFPIFVYSAAVTIAAVLVYQYQPFDAGLVSKIRIPIYVPDDFRVYMLISALVTVVFFSSLYFFIRVIMRNCFLPIIPDLLILSLFMGLNESVIKGTADIRLSLLDPFITAFFVGNTVPNEIVDTYPEMSLLRNAWTVNRLIFFFLSLLLLAATIFLLRREKLHRGVVE